MTINPTTPTTKRLSLDLPQSLVERIEAEATARLVGRALLIEHLIIDGLTRLTPIEDVFGQRDRVD